MALTAREWLLLLKDEQERKREELSPYECFLLRTELAYIHFTEKEKASLTEQQKYEFTHPKIYTEEEKQAFNKQAEIIFTQLINETQKSVQQEKEQK